MKIICTQEEKEMILNVIGDGINDHFSCYRCGSPDLCPCNCRKCAESIIQWDVKDGDGDG